jgi:hypothetical protein
MLSWVGWRKIAANQLFNRFLYNTPTVEQG